MPPSSQSKGAFERSRELHMKLLILVNKYISKEGATELLDFVYR